MDDSDSIGIGFRQLHGTTSRPASTEATSSTGSTSATNSMIGVHVSGILSILIYGAG